MTIFAVTVERFGQWDWSRGLREQDGWDAHAAFMDRLAGEGFIVLGGPLADSIHVLHIVEASSEDEIRQRLARDPWHGTLLRIKRIEPWEILLGDAGRLRQDLRQPQQHRQ